ncbi:glycosyltransferase [Falsirhodobacter algicola]|uniref:Glycosyltransferase n=1 Tax=Falsirhodobacter algicola TaxID=2692330 RepID=A0A8J8SKL7_9RHOB|nr:glycosyltransferase [Falsirhodobacter algicola]QUS36085.1 glycosyltransferase [Falsirhodobacter algicola]
MRILYVSRETPIHPAGGIATYLSYMVPAMRDAGHEVFLFSWTEGPGHGVPADTAPFPPGHVHLENVDLHEAWRCYPSPARNLFLANWLSQRIAAKVAEWGIDVIEATDYLSPCLDLYQNLQSASGADRQLCVTYNHGFIEDFYEADQIRLSPSSRIDHLCERQQCRISDLTIAPSETARGRLASYGIHERVEMIREPYLFRKAAHQAPLRTEINYIGRISLSKGIDKVIYLANLIEPVMPLREIRLIGRIVDTPFRNSDMRSYVLSRLNPDIRDRTSFTGFLPRDSALRLLEPGAICPSLGSAETFSYACVESIDAGLLPVVRFGTPMAEFFPEHLHAHVLDEQMRSVRGLQQQMEAMAAEATSVMRDVREHCEATLAPARIAEEMGCRYDRALRDKRGATSVAVPRRPMTAADVTVLIPAYKPTAEFMETVDSLAAQTIGPPRVIICDDGTPESHQHWFDYARACLPDLEIIRQPNAGLLASRNTLIEACDTPLSVFIDTDDMFLPDLIGNMLEAWNHSPMRPDAVIPQRRNFGESNEAVMQHLLGDHMHLLVNDYRMTSLIRTDILREIGFDATRRNGEGDDWAFWLSFTGRGHRGILLPQQGFLYRFRKGSMSWPWSEGQDVGGQLMLRDSILEMCRTHPSHVTSLVRANYARTVSLA